MIELYTVLLIKKINSKNEIKFKTKKFGGNLIDDLNINMINKVRTDYIDFICRKDLNNIFKKIIF